MRTRILKRAAPAALMITAVMVLARPALEASASSSPNGCITDGGPGTATCPSGSPHIAAVDGIDGASASGVVYAAGGVITGAGENSSGEVASLGALRLNAPIVGVVGFDAESVAGANTGSALLAASDGGVFALNAAFWGSMAGQRLNAPIVGIAAQNNDGYWLVAADGGVFTFGDPDLPDSLHFYGSLAGLRLNAPIVGMVPSPDYEGYWLVGADGGVFAFGDATYYGSRAGQPLDGPVVGMASADDGHGYWLVTSEGGIFTYGSAPFLGADLGQAYPAVGISDVVPYCPPVPGITCAPEGYEVAYSNGQLIQNSP